MADENHDAEVPSENAEEVTADTEAEQPVAETDPNQVAAEAETEEPVAEAGAEAEPEAEQAKEPVAQVEAEPVAEVEAGEEPDVDEAAEEGSGSSETPEETVADVEPPAVSAPKKKRKRLPRAERRQRTTPKREKPKERKPTTRLPKPEHARGRRQERQGTVVTAASDKTIVVRVDVVKVHPMYKKVIRRSTKLHAHDEENQAKVGDIVRIVETRPLSRLKRWRLQEIVEAAK